MPLARALLAILAAASALQEGPAAPPKPQDEPKQPEFLGPKPPTREEKAAVSVERKERELRAQRAAASSQRLAVFEIRLSEEWLAGRPALARERGMPPRDLPLLDLGPESRRTWRGAMQKAQGDLLAVDWPNLEPTRKLDRDWLEAFLAAELALDALVPERGSPMHALSEVEGVLTGVLGAPELDADTRIQVLTRHLNALPAALSALRSSLAHPEPAACQYAVVAADDLLLLLQARLTPRLAAERPTPELWEPFDTAQEAAEHAVLGFRAWLEEEAKREGAAPVLGAGGWRLVLGSLTGTQIDLEVLKVRLLRDLSALDAGLDAPKAEKEDWHESLLPARVTQRLRETQAAGWNAALDLGLVKGELPAVGCATWTAGALPGKPLELHWGERPVMFVVASGAAWSPEQTARRQAELTADAQRAHALAVGFPGSLWELWSRRCERPSQRVLWNRAQREGFALYAADFATRPLVAGNPLAGDAKLAAEVRRDRQLEAARLLASLELHTAGASVEEAAHGLRDFAGLDPKSAAFEARLALVDPLQGCGYLGYLELLAAEETLRQRLPEREAVWWIGRLLRNAPSAPIRGSVAAFDAFQAEFASEVPEEPEVPVETPAPGAQEGR
jgi:hypothetical protein